MSVQFSIQKRPENNAKEGPQDVPKSVQRPPESNKVERPEKHEFSGTLADTPGDPARRGEPSPRGSIYIVDIFSIFHWNINILPIFC